MFNNNNERDNMSKEYDTTDHITVLSELNVLYILATETNAKIDTKNKNRANYSTLFYWTIGLNLQLVIVLDYILSFLLFSVLLFEICFSLTST